MPSISAAPIQPIQPLPIQPMPGSWAALWRAMKRGYAAEPSLISVSFGLAMLSAIPDALLALLLKLLADGILGHRPTVVTAASIGLGVSVAATWFLRVISDRTQRRFRDRITIALESQVAHLQASVASIEHHERPEYLDRLGMLRDQVFVLDMQGSVLQKIGKRGDGPGEFNYPTELRLDGDEIIVVDAMNFRVQVFDRSGTFQFAIGKIGSSTGAVFRPKAVGVDSEGDVYVVDGLWSVVQAFNRQGELLYYFGGKGTEPGQFQLPSGMFIDHNDRIFVVDSFNRRIQIFHFYALKKSSKDGM